VPGLAAGGSNRADGERLTRVDAVTWRVTLAALPGTTFAYKIALNPSARSIAEPGWQNVERAGDCAETVNRVLQTPATGDATASITVANWRGANGC
jgi:hypothetical protein